MLAVLSVQQLGVEDERHVMTMAKLVGSSTAMEKRRQHQRTHKQIDSKIETAMGVLLLTRGYVHVEFTLVHGEVTRPRRSTMSPSGRKGRERR